MLLVASLRLEGEKREHEVCIPIAVLDCCPEATLLSLQRVRSMMLGASREMPRTVLKTSWRISFEGAQSHEAEVVG